MLNKEVNLSPVVGAGQQISYSAISVQSLAVNSSVVDLSCSTPCWIVFGSNPTAIKPTGYFMSTAGVRYRFGITPGSIIAAIRDTTDGVLTINPVS